MCFAMNRVWMCGCVWVCGCVGEGGERGEGCGFEEVGKKFWHVLSWFCGWRLRRKQCVLCR